MRWRGRILLLIGSSVVAFAAAELAMRAWLSRNPTLLYSGQRADWEQPVLFDPDPVLGWRNRPGEHRLRFTHDGQRIVIETHVRPDGSRDLGDGTTSRDAEDVVVIGGSYAFGWGVADDDAFAAHLARDFPERSFANIACGGYGTYQALLSLEQRYQDRPPPRVVLYGFASHHLPRNIAQPVWLTSLYYHSARGHVQIPYVSVDAGGGLIEVPPQPIYPTLRYVRWSKLLTQVDLWREREAFVARGTNPVVAAAKITERLRDWCRARGAVLLIAYMDDAQREGLVPVFEALGVSCVLAGAPTPLPYDPHPDASYHRDLAERLREPLGDLLGG